MDGLLDSISTSNLISHRATFCCVTPATCRDTVSVFRFWAAMSVRRCGGACLPGCNKMLHGVRRHLVLWWEMCRRCTGGCDGVVQLFGGWVASRTALRE